MENNKEKKLNSNDTKMILFSLGASPQILDDIESIQRNFSSIESYSSELSEEIKDFSKMLEIQIILNHPNIEDFGNKKETKELFSCMTAEVFESVEKQKTIEFSIEQFYKDNKKFGKNIIKQFDEFKHEKERISEQKSELSRKTLHKLRKTAIKTTKKIKNHDNNACIEGHDSIQDIKRGYLEEQRQINSRALSKNEAFRSQIESLTDRSGKHSSSLQEIENKLHEQTIQMTDTIIECDQQIDNIDHEPDISTNPSYAMPEITSEKSSPESREPGMENKISDKKEIIKKENKKEEAREDNEPERVPWWAE